MRQKVFVIGVLLAIGLTGVLLIRGTVLRDAAVQTDPSLLGTLWPEPRPLTGFLLSDHRGQAFAEEQFKGQWSLVFFGYTSCPDICPITMAILGHLVSQMQEQQLTVPRVFMVSLDPERDDADKLGQYVGYFGDDLTGLRGSPDQLDTLARQIGAVYERSIQDEQGNYDIAHSASVFVVDPLGRLYSVLSPPHEVSAMVSKLVAIQRHFDRG